jgi:hypothetical protein
MARLQILFAFVALLLLTLISCVPTPPPLASPSPGTNPFPRSPLHHMAYLINDNLTYSSIVAIDLTTQAPSSLPAIKSPAGTHFRFLVIAPNARIAYVTTFSLAPGKITLPTLVPIDLTAFTSLPAVTLPHYLIDFVLSPDGATAYALSQDSLTTIDLINKNLQVTTPGPLKTFFEAIAISPDNSTAYITAHAPGTAVPPALNLVQVLLRFHRATDTFDVPFPLPPASEYSALAITSDGATIYAIGSHPDPVSDTAVHDSVLPVRLATNVPLSPIVTPVGLRLGSRILLTPNAIYVLGVLTNIAGAGSVALFPIDLTSSALRPSVTIPQYLGGFALAPDGETIYMLVGSASGIVNLLPFDLATNTLLSPVPSAVSVGGENNFVAIAH